MISDPYAAGYTFARSAFTGGPTRDQKAVRTIYIYIYTDSEIIVLTRWGSLRLAPITIKPILKENSDLTFSFKLFPFLVTSMSKTYKKE